MSGYSVVESEVDEVNHVSRQRAGFESRAVGLKARFFTLVALAELRAFCDL
jgi:hypothetical protein